MVDVKGAHRIPLAWRNGTLLGTLSRFRFIYVDKFKRSKVEVVPMITFVAQNLQNLSLNIYFFNCIKKDTYAKTLESCFVQEKCSLNFSGQNF